MLTNSLKFTKPPVVETVLGVQFEPVAMKIIHYGLFWQKINVNGEFPEVEEKPRLLPEIEGRDAGLVPQFFFQAWLSQSADLPRAWFLSPHSQHGQTLIQVQPDRLLQNWRRNSLEDASYSSFDVNKVHFENALKAFELFLAEQKLGTLKANQCEVSYVNRIPVESPLSLWQTCSKVFSLFDNVQSKATGGEFPDRLAASWSSWRDELNGRLHFSVGPAVIKETAQQVIDFRITARGAPSGESLSAIMEWLERGHAQVVTSFELMTSSAMHSYWEKN